MDRNRKVALVLSIMEAVDDEETKKNRSSSTFFSYSASFFNFGVDVSLEADFE